MVTKDPLTIALHVVACAVTIGMILAAFVAAMINICVM